MQPREIFERLQARFGENAAEFNADVVSPFIRFEAGAIIEIMRYLRDDSKLLFDYLLCLGAVDYVKDNQIALSYHFDSTTWKHRIALKTFVPRDTARLKSISGIWKAANWHEREAFDLMGVTFDGHPNLTRILMPEDWEGHPLRKDYKQPAFYNGIPTNVQ